MMDVSPNSIIDNIKIMKIKSSRIFTKDIGLSKTDQSKNSQ